MSVTPGSPHSPPSSVHTRRWPSVGPVPWLQHRGPFSLSHPPEPRLLPSARQCGSRVFSFDLSSAGRFIFPAACLPPLRGCLVPDLTQPFLSRLFFPRLSPSESAAKPPIRLLTQTRRGHLWFLLCTPPPPPEVVSTSKPHSKTFVSSPFPHTAWSEPHPLLLGPLQRPGPRFLLSLQPIPHPTAREIL